MVIVSPTTMSPVVNISAAVDLCPKCLNCPNRKLHSTCDRIFWNAEVYVPNVPSVATVPTIPSCLTSAARYFHSIMQGICKLSTPASSHPHEGYPLHPLHLLHMLTRSFRHSNLLYFFFAHLRAR